MKCETEFSRALDYAGAGPDFVRFEWPSESPSRRVKAKGDCLRVLICHVECVAQVHEEGVTVPVQAIIDVGI